MSCRSGTRRLRKTVLVLIASTIGSALAFAQTATVTLDACNSPCQLGSGPYATVTKVQSGGSVTITETAASGFALIGPNANNGVLYFNSDQALNFGTITGTYSSLTSSGTPGTTSTAFSTSTTQQADGLGTFSYDIVDSSASNRYSSITFTVTNSTNDLTLSDVDRTCPGGSGCVNSADTTYEFASHIYSGGTGQTGFGAGPVPETTSISLFGSALLLAGVWVRKRLSNRA